MPANNQHQINFANPMTIKGYVYATVLTSGLEMIFFFSKIDIFLLRRHEICFCSTINDFLFPGHEIFQSFLIKFLLLRRYKVHEMTWRTLNLLEFFN